MADANGHARRLTPDLEALAKEFMETVVVPWATRLRDYPNVNTLQVVMVNPMLDFLAYHLLGAVEPDELHTYATAIAQTLHDNFLYYVQERAKDEE